MAKKFDDNINFRTYSSRKSKTKRIIDLINEKRNPKEPKKSLGFIETYFIQSYKHNEEFFIDLKIWDLEEELENLTEELEIIQFKINKRTKELEHLLELKKNDKLDKYIKPSAEEEIKETPILKEAFNNLLRTCKQRKIYYFLDVPSELFIAKAEAFEEVLPEDLKFLLERELEKDPDLIRNFEL